MKKPVIIDCDPGHDDAVALLMAFAGDMLEVKAVITVGGSQTGEKTLNNALRVLSYAGITCVPVAAGAGNPLIRELQIAPEIYGKSGLDGSELPPPVFEPSPKGAMQLMEESILASDEKITLVSTGPLTNIAALFLTVPEIKEKIERITLTGGSAVGGNRTPAAEFNILVDPEAAVIVFQSGIPITMCGLDVTNKAKIFDHEIEEIHRQGGNVAIMAAELLDFYAKFYKTFNFGGSPLHAPCTVACLIDPTLLVTKRLHVAIETRGEFTTGTTVVDIYGVTGKKPNVDVAFDIDRQRFIALLHNSLKKYT